MLKQKTNKNGSFAALVSISVLLLLVILLENLSDYIPGLPAVFLPTSQLFTVLKKGAVYSLVAVSMNLLNGFTGLFSLGQAGFMLLGAYTYAILTVPMAAKDQVYYLYGGSAVKFSLVDCFQSFLGSAGFGGGLALVLAVLVGLILAGLVAALFAALIGLPVLRLKSDYLAIATLGFAEVVRIVVASSPLNRITNGSLGLTKIPGFSSYYGIFIVAAVCITLIVLIINSSYGRAFKAIRDDEIAAEAMGIDLAKHKQMSFIISSFFAAIGGALMAMFLGAVSSTTFTIAVTYFILLIVVIGGMGSVTGSVISAFLVIASREWWLRFLDKTTYIGDFRVPLLKTGFRMVVFSVILMVVVLFFRTGIMGDKEFSWDRIAARCKKLFGGKKAAVSGGENHE